jgi:plasmid maintenance system antidote protein VapI
VKRTLEQQFLDEIAHVMRVKDITQTDFANAKGVTRQSVNAIFTGRTKMLTGTARGLLEYLGVRVKLELIEKE